MDAVLLDYKNVVHEFATLVVLLKTPQAQACAEDIAIWVKKYISVRGHEFFLLTMLTKRGIRVFVEGKEYG